MTYGEVKEILHKLLDTGSSASGCFLADEEHEAVYVALSCFLEVVEAAQIKDEETCVHDMTRL